MTITLNPNVFKDNVIDGKLQAGTYNVAYAGVSSFAPMYAFYDGTSWNTDTDSMIVFCRVSDGEIPDDY